MSSSPRAAGTSDNRCGPASGGWPSGTRFGTGSPTSTASTRDFETLVRLHELRWGGTTAVFAGRGHAFQRDAARALLATGRLRLWVLELDGEPAAAWQGFRMDGAESYYQSGRDPRFDSESAGFVLLCHTIREALADGMGEYRFLLGGEAYKDRFANADPGVVSLVVATSPLGRAALARAGGGACRALWRRPER